MKLRFWKDSGKWCCANPRTPFYLSMYKRDIPWWKTNGIIGYGLNPERAKNDFYHQKRRCILNKLHGEYE